MNHLKTDSTFAFLVAFAISSKPKRTIAHLCNLILYSTSISFFISVPGTSQIW